MVDWRGEFGQRVARETGIAVATWVAATTALFVGFHQIRSAYMAPYARREQLSTDLAWEMLPVDDVPLPAQLLDWLWSFATFQFGYSPRHDELVLSVFLDGLRASLPLVAVVLVVGFVATLALASLVASLDGPLEHATVATMTYAFQVFAPVTALGLLYVLEVHGLELVGMSDDSWASARWNPRTIVIVGTLVAVPMVGHAVRRVQRVVRAGPGPNAGAVDLLRRAVRPLDAWVYLTYVLSSLFVVEQSLWYRGIGHVVALAVEDSDAPTLLGVLGGLVWCLVAVRYGWNLWSAVRDRRGADRNGSTGAGVSAPDVATVLRAVLTQRKVLAGAGLLGVTAVVSFTGSFLTAPEVAPVGAGGTESLYAGVGPRLVLNNVASLLAIAAVAVVVALLFGAPAALVAAYAESTVEEWPSRVLQGLRAPADALLLGPVGFVLGFAVVRIGSGTPQPVEELRFGVAGGLVLTAYTFHAVYEAASGRFDGVRNPEAVAVEALVAGVARVDAVVVGILFAVAEWAFLRPGETIIDVSRYVLDLGQGFHNLGTWVVLDSAPDPEWLVEALFVQAALILAIPVLGVVLLADGLEEAALELRAAGTDEPEKRSTATGEGSTATDESVATSTPESGDGS